MFLKYKRISAHTIEIYDLIVITVLSEMTRLSLELVKKRISSPKMTPDLRRTFINSSIVSIIEKSHDAKLIEHVIKVSAEWRFKYIN